MSARRTARRRHRRPRTARGAGGGGGGHGVAGPDRPRRDASLRRRGARRPHRPAGARGDGDRARGGGPGLRARQPAAGRPGRAVPLLGDAAARAAVAARRHGGPPARRPAPPGAPGPHRPRDRPGRRRGRAGPVTAAAAGARARRPRAGRARAGPGVRPRRRRPAPRRPGVRPGGAGREARRVRGPRRDRRRLPPTEEHPVRVEFWGDTVEEVRFFKVADQRSLPGDGPAHGLWAPPCRELLLTPDVRERARLLAQSHPELAEICERIADGTPVEGMEALAPVLVDDLVLLVDELPAGTTVVDLRPRADPHPRPRPGAHQPGVPRGVLGDRCRRRGRAGRPGRRGVPLAGRRPRRTPPRSGCAGGR